MLDTVYIYVNIFISLHIYLYYADQCADQCTNMTTNAFAVPLTAVLCTTISSVISTLVTTLVMYYCIMKRKKKEIREDDKQVTPKAEPMYDTPQVFGESSADIQLKENTCYASAL